MKTIDTYINEKLNISTKYTYKPKDKEELRYIIEERLTENEDANLNNIDISYVKDMSDLFYRLDPHNIDISEWDVSNVTNMKSMFFGCENFNSNLSEWDVSKVEHMVAMFKECEKFNSDLNKWDVSNVKSMLDMFSGCKSLKNIPNWYNEEDN